MSVGTIYPPLHLFPLLPNFLSAPHAIPGNQVETLTRTDLMTSNRLLILDDDPVVLTFLGEVGRGYHYDVALTQSVDELGPATTRSARR